MRVLLVSANRERHPSPVIPLGVLTIAGALRPAHEVRVLDLCFEPNPETALTRAIDEHAPDAVGIGLRNLHGSSYRRDERLIDGYERLVERVGEVTSAPVILGGAAFSLQPERLLERLGADYGVVGEGEEALPALLATLESGARPPRLVRGAASGRLDALPRPARDLTDPRYHRFDGVEPVQSKRGCAFACSYCGYPDLEGHLVRVRDPALVVDEILELAAQPEVRALFFVDSVFNVPRRHALALCRRLADAGAPLPWVCYASPVGLDDELAQAMAAAGCAGAELGTDAGTAEGLARLHKPFSLDQVRRAHRALARAGVRDCHTFVVGAFGETAGEVERTLAFVDEINPDVAVFVVFSEDRETRTGGAQHRQAILELLEAEAPRRAGWVVPELEIHFGPKVHRFLSRHRLAGPAWLHLARMREVA